MNDTQLREDTAAAFVQLAQANLNAAIMVTEWPERHRLKQLTGELADVRDMHEDYIDALTAKHCDCAKQDAYAAREAEQRADVTITHRAECVACGWKSGEREDAGQATVDAIQHAGEAHGGHWRGRVQSTARPEQREAAEPHNCLPSLGDPCGDCHRCLTPEEAGGPDPLDEDDHRDRMLVVGVRLVRVGHKHWHTPGRVNCQDEHDYSLEDWRNASLGPLTFAPDTAPQATGDDLTASGDEGGPVEGSDADDAQEAILCPECDDHINTHNVAGCRFILCGCPRTPEDITHVLIAEAVKAERGKLAEELRGVEDKTLTDWRPATVSRVIRDLAESWEQQ